MRNMRKITASILAAALTIGAAAMEASANTADTSRVCPQNCTCGNGNFVDENNDGICDNCAGGVRPQNGTGKGNRRGNGSFIDENNDGICDNSVGGVCPQNGTGKGNRHGKGCDRRRCRV